MPDNYIVQSDIELCYYNNTLYCIYSKVRKTDTNLFLVLDKYNGDIVSYDLKLPKYDDWMAGKGFILDFDLNKEYLVISGWNCILIYKYENDTYKLIKNIERPVSYFHCKLEGSQVTAFDAMLGYYYEKPESNTYIYTYNIKDDISKQHYFEDNEDIYWTLFQPRKLIDHSIGITAVSKASEYNIKLYDENFKLIDSLVRQPEKWKSIDTVLNFDYSEHPKNAIENVKGIYSRISLMKSIDFIDNNRIMISWKKPRPNNSCENYGSSIVFDFWEKKEGSWSQVNTDLSNDPQFDSDKFNPENIDLTGYYKVSNGKLLTCHRIPFILDDRFRGMTVSEFKEYKDNFLLDNDLKLSILVNDLK